MVTDDAAKADMVAEQLNAENALRQEISRKIFIEAEAMLAQQERIETAIVLAKEGWHAGVIGIVASRLVDKYHLPTILISIDGEAAKGSCRSIPALDLYSALNECSELLLQFGGHHQAAGLTLRAARVESFKKRFLGVVRGRLEPADYQPRLSRRCLPLRMRWCIIPRLSDVIITICVIIPITASTIITVLCGTVRLIWPAFIITRLSIWRLCRS